MYVFISIPFAGHGALAKIEAFQQQWGISDNPTMDSGVIDADAALGHHFFKIAQAQAIGQVPDDR